MAQMTETELKALTDAEMRQAIGYFGGKLSEQRRKAEYYYLGLAKGDLSPPEIEGRSSVIAPVVRNTIESMMPQLMVKFTGGDKVVEFEPTQPEDEKAASNATEYLNYLFFKKNNGHQVTYTWFKDALLQKRGIIKVWWDDRHEQTREEYRGLNQVELAQIMDDEEIEVTEQKQYPDEDDAEQRQKALEQANQQLAQATQAAQQGNPQAQQDVQAIQAHIQQINATPPAMLFDIVAKRTNKAGQVKIENVPPEEFLISRKAKSIADAPFVAHRVQRTISELKSMGYKNVDSIESDDAAVSLNAERIERIAYDDEQAYLSSNTPSMDPSQRVVWVTECYLRCDWDGDGIAELRKVCRAGNQILSNEVVDIVPFVSICPVPQPHKFFGLSVADLAMEGQKTETAILRSTLDNLYLSVNKRMYAVEGQVNLDDLLTSRPGGVVRIKAPGMAGPLDAGGSSLPESLQMLEYMSQFNEESTGWSRNSAGTDPQALNQTATATQIVTNKADMRVDLIARNFAEGFVELFRLMLKLVCQHQDKEAVIALNGEWVAMDPREWRNQFDVSINVGLGVGNKDQQVGHLMALLDRQQQAFAIGVATPLNVYETLGELAKAMGFKNPDKFVTKPDPNKPPPDPMQGQMQVEQMKAQVQAQADHAKAQAALQVEQMKAQMQAEVDRNRQQAEAEQHALKVQKEAELSQLEAQLKDQQHQRDIEFERWKAELQANTQIVIAEMNNKSSMQQHLLTTNAANAGAMTEISEDGTAKPAGALSSLVEAINSNIAQLMGIQQQNHAQIVQALTRPKQIIRDANGRAQGVA